MGREKEKKHTSHLHHTGGKASRKGRANPVDLLLILPWQRRRGKRKRGRDMTLTYIF